MSWRCRLGWHRWVLYPATLRQDAAEPAYVCERCGREPLVW